MNFRFTRPPSRAAAYHLHFISCIDVDSIEPKKTSPWRIYGIYTIPQISFIEKTEEQLTEADVPYEVGVAYYREVARGQITGHTDGRLKILFHRETLELLGVHIFGEDAAELLHIGQAVLLLKGKITYFVNTVFNYPALAECYKAAAFNGLNRLG